MNAISRRTMSFPIIIIRRNHKMFMPCGFCVDHLLFAIFVTLQNENRPFGLADHILLLFEIKKRIRFEQDVWIPIDSQFHAIRTMYV